MSKEKELLKKILATGWLNNELSCEIEELLAQPEQDNIQYLLDQVARLTAENAMLKEKWLAQPEQEPKGYVIYKPEGSEEEEIIPLYTAPPKREPLSDGEITTNTPKLIPIGERLAFHAGIRFAEVMHGITGVDDE